MGKITRKVDPTAKSGIAPYDGDEPKPGMYRARIIKCSIRKAKSTESLSYNVFYELVATKPEHKKYDGYSGFAELWLGDKEALLAREAAFYKAITGKAYKNVEDVNVVFEGEEDDFSTNGGAEVTKIDGKSPKGRIVKVNLQIERGGAKPDGSGDKYEDRLRVNDIYPSADADEAAKSASSTAEMEDDDEDDAPDFVKDALADDEELSTDEDLEAEIEARRKELRSRAYGLPKLKEACQAAGIYEKGMDKTALVEAILKYEFEDEDGEADDADDEDEPSTASVVTSEDEEDDEEEEEEDDEEEEEEDEDEDDPEAELREELADLDRVALKKRIKANDEGFSVKKSMTDDDLRDAIVKQELDSSPF